MKSVPWPFWLVWLAHDSSDRHCGHRRHRACRGPRITLDARRRCCAGMHHPGSEVKLYEVVAKTFSVFAEYPTARWRRIATCTYYIMSVNPKMLLAGGFS